MRVPLELDLKAFVVLCKNSALSCSAVFPAPALFLREPCCVLLWRSWNSLCWPLGWLNEVNLAQCSCLCLSSPNISGAVFSLCDNMFTLVYSFVYMLFKKCGVWWHVHSCDRQSKMRLGFLLACVSPGSRWVIRHGRHCLHPLSHLTDPLLGLNHLLLFSTVVFSSCWLMSPPNFQRVRWLWHRQSLMLCGAISKSCISKCVPMACL